MQHIFKLTVTQFENGEETPGNAKADMWWTNHSFCGPYPYDV